MAALVHFLLGEVESLVRSDSGRIIGKRSGDKKQGNESDYVFHDELRNTPPAADMQAGTPRFIRPMKSNQTNHPAKNDFFLRLLMPLSDSRPILRGSQVVGYNGPVT